MTGALSRVTVVHWWLLVLLLLWNGCVSHEEHARIDRDCREGAE